MKKRAFKYLESYRELVNYLFFGVLTTLVNVFVFFFLDRVLAWPYLWANALAIILSILFAYATNKRFVFESKQQGFLANLKEFIRFISARFLSGTIDMLVLWVLVSGLGFSTTFAKLVTQVIVVILNYWFSKVFVFRKRENRS